MTQICLVTQDPSWGGGVFTHLLSFMRFAASRGYSCDVYFPSRNVDSARQGIQKISGHPAIRKTYPVLRPEKLPSFARDAMFGRRCKFAHCYDGYVQITGGLNQGLPFAYGEIPQVAWVAGTAASDTRSMPKTNWKHHLLYNRVTEALTRRQECQTAANAKTIIAVSTYSRQQLTTELKLADTKVRVLPVPVEIENFKVRQIGDGQRPYILSVAQLERRKDFPTLLKAFRVVVDRFQHVELRIVGHGKERDTLIRMAAELGLQGNVKFLGFVDDAELSEQYCGATAFTLASRQEGLGIVYLEAMAYGVPVVATDCGGSADPIENGVTGFLSPVGDHEQLARNLIEVLQRKDVAMKFSEAGRHRVEEKFSDDTVFAQLDVILMDAFGISASSEN